MHKQLQVYKFTLLYCSSDNPSRSYCGASSSTTASCDKAKGYNLPTANSVNMEAKAASRKMPSREPSPPREAYYATLDEVRASAMDDLFATEV